MLITDFRAAAILFNFLVSGKFKKKFFIPANACPIIPFAFLKARVPFELIDISDDYLIDQNIVSEKLKSKSAEYDGIIFIRTYGLDDDRNSFFKELKKISPQFTIIDDKCLCKPELIENSESSADLTLFSLGYAKYVDIGRGAYAFIRSDANIEYRSFLKEFDSRDLNKLNSAFGEAMKSQALFNYSSELNWLQSNDDEIIDFEELKKYIYRTENHKSNINAIYFSNLPGNICLNQKYQNWRFNILVDPLLKDKLIESIFAEGFFCSSHYKPLSGVFEQGISPNASQLADCVINLFNDKYIKEEQANMICKIINQNL